MKIKLIAFLLLCVVGIGTAQNSGKITGKITEKTTNTPISYAIVSVKDNGKVISGANTDDNG